MCSEHTANIRRDTTANRVNRQTSSDTSVQTDKMLTWMCRDDGKTGENGNRPAHRLVLLMGEATQDDTLLLADASARALIGQFLNPTDIK